MRIGDLLDELRSALPDCRLCAYIDLDVQLVLSCSAAARQRQERLDDLAKLAAALMAPSQAQPLDRSADAQPKMITVMQADRSIFLMRAPDDPSEVICCECAANVDPRSVAAGAKLVLTWIGDAA